MKKEIEGCGFACIDYIQADKSIRSDIGGTCANVLSFLSFLGWKSHIWMPMYAEEDLSHWLKDRGVHIEYFVKTQKKVPIIVQISNGKEGTHRFITRCPRCGSRLTETSLPTRRQMQTDKGVPDLFFCDRISEGILSRAMQVTESGGITMYEPNGLRTYNQLLTNCKKFHIIKFSEEKIPENWQQNLLTDLKNENVKLIIVTKGERGLKFVTQQKWMWTDIGDIHYMDARDSSGAGDWLTAVFLDRITPQIRNGKDELDYKAVCSSLRCAMRVAEISCNEIGAHGMLHSRRRLKELKEIIDISYLSEMPICEVNGNIVCPNCKEEMLKIEGM